MIKITFNLGIFLILLGTGISMENQTSENIIGLTTAEKRYLLALARSTIREYLKDAKLPEASPPSDKLKEQFGVFVTLHKRGKLRGCIGYVEGIDELYKSVITMAHSAAFRDPRFPPVEEEEVKELEIEISVLSPLKKIDKVDEIVVGRHGLLISQGISRGLLLPQVAPDWGWNRKEFLEQTCQKAGLAPDAWQDSQTEIYVFTAEIFSEKDFE
jgi:AmmeMemoRadiSam system protein A